MPAIVTSADGNTIFLALADGDGNQVIVKATRTDLSTWAAAYEPGGGTAANVAAVPGDPDQVIFHGHFGSGVQVVRHTISTGANSNISPVGLADKVVNVLAINPSDPLEMWCVTNTDQDLLHTADGGASWETLNSALGFSATALAVLWSGAYEPDRGFIAGAVAGPAAQLLYTPNEGASSADLASVALAAVANICSVEVAEV